MGFNLGFEGLNSEPANMLVTLADLDELSYYTRYAQRLVMKFCFYLTENSMCFHYKWQPLNIMQEQ